jgi:SAM-dependent methyltransferase
VTQEQVRAWWNRNPMSYDVDKPIAAETGSPEYFRELDSRVFAPRVLRLTRGPDGRPFSRFVPFGDLAEWDVLEVGCGSGFAVQLFAEAGARVTAIDLTDWAVATTRARLDAFGLDGEVQRGDGEALPFADASFDLVFSWGVIHHSSNMEAALRELVRVCRPGGRLVLMVYNRRSLRRLLADPISTVRHRGDRAGADEALRARYDATADGAAAPHTDFVTAPELRGLLHGFHDVRIERRNMQGMPIPYASEHSRSAMMALRVDRLLGLDLYATARR